MPDDYIAFHQRNGQLCFVVDFHKERCVVRANTAWIEGIYLDQIPGGENKFAPGMVLYKRGWENIYFVKERPNWGEEEYFRYAGRIMRRENIKTP